LAYPGPVDAESAVSGPSPRPRLRGVWHQSAFVVAIPLGIMLVLSADTARARAAAAVFAASVALMFGASALYHRVTWSPTRRLWLRRLDHAGIFGLIAGTYTPFGLLVLEGSWRVAVLAIVWGGAAIALALKLLWPSGPKWISALVGVGLGWTGIAAFPELVDKAGLTAPLLALAGGVCYTLGAVIYVRRKPNPVPGVFGYHEVFHAVVIAAVALQYAAVALVVV
jgi:hemolysin III